MRQLIASDAAALERFNSSLLESYVEVRQAQALLLSCSLYESLLCTNTPLAMRRMHQKPATESSRAHPGTSINLEWDCFIRTMVSLRCSAVCTNQSACDVLPQHAVPWVTAFWVADKVLCAPGLPCWCTQVHVEEMTSCLRTDHPAWTMLSLHAWISLNLRTPNYWRDEGYTSLPQVGGKVRKKS